MARAYSNDLRERVVGSVQSGRSCRATAALFGVSVASVVKWAARFRQTGSAAAKPMGGSRRRLNLSGERDWLLSRLAEKGVTLRSLIGELAERGARVSYGALWLFVHREGLSFPPGGPARRRAGPRRRRPAAHPLEGAPRAG